MALAWGGHGVGKVLHAAQTKPRQSEIRSAGIIIPVILSIHRARHLEICQRTQPGIEHVPERIPDEVDGDHRESPTLTLALVRPRW